jgi:hypothetical protein
MTAPGGSTAPVAPVPPTGFQGFTVSVPAGLAAGGGTANFLFTLTPDLSAVGSTYPIAAHFTSGYSGSDTAPIQVVSSFDPNDKSGPAGVGTAHYIKGNSPLQYQISFENDPLLASAAAQRVAITDQLDVSKVDASSLRFGPVTFANQLVTPPFGASSFSLVVPFDVDGNPLTPLDNLDVHIDGNLDLNPLSSTYGLVSWVFQAIDTNTALPPIFEGFLLPNITPPEGQGAVWYTVSALPGLVDGSIITNAAAIIFDTNPQILTGTWTNTILTATPPLTIQRVGNEVEVTWSTWILQEASVVTGPWADTAVQVSPWTFTPTAPANFFRLRIP